MCSAGTDTRGVDSDIDPDDYEDDDDLDDDEDERDEDDEEDDDENGPKWYVGRWRRPCTESILALDFASGTSYTCPVS